MPSAEDALPRLDLQSADVTAETLDGLKALVPSAFGEDGKIDWGKLQTLLGAAVSTERERYTLTWAGKREAVAAVRQGSTGALVPMPEASVDWDETGNAIIEGDNLEVLKLLQKAYHGRVKMVYIDPPYNTGNDFIYPDDFREGMQKYLEYTGQATRRVSAEQERENQSGRRHSAWLSMMFPRMFLARNLLREDGVIFVSIDDNEVAALRMLMNEVFGEENFVANIVWQKRTAPDARLALGPAHDSIVVFARNVNDLANVLGRLPVGEARSQEFKNPDDDPRGEWASVDLTGQTGHATASQYYTVVSPSGVGFPPPAGRCWALSEKTFKELDADKRIWWGANGANRPRLKKFLAEATGVTDWTWWDNKTAGHNQEATKELADVLGRSSVFDTPKPTKLIRRMLQLATKKEDSDLVVDFFSGSGATGQAVLDQNLADGGNRQFILIQLPEPTEDLVPDTKAGPMRTIADITRERVRRAGARLNAETQPALDADGGKPDRGFRAFRLAPSHFLPWTDDTGGDAAALADKLRASAQGVLDQADPQGVLFEVLLKSGFPLSVPVETVEVGSLPTYRVDGGRLLVCLSLRLTDAGLRALIAEGPERIVVLDDGFGGDDALKANIAQQVKQHNALHKNRPIDLRTV